MNRIISLGAGVQSSTMLLMALHSEFDLMPDAAIFADTRWESRATYNHLALLEAYANKFNFQIYRVSAGHILENEFVRMPLHVRNLDGGRGMLRRQCTREMKISPLNRKMREIVGLKPKQHSKIPIVEVWLGISLDEISRMRDSRERWKTHYYPLIEKRMTRNDCLAWLKANNFPEPPKSACLGCPYHDDNFWRALKNESPKEFAEVCAVDEKLREQNKGVECKAYIHRSLVPLAEVDLSTAEERGQGNLFNNECEGMCGV